jgi:uncharacterized membrane protein
MLFAIEQALARVLPRTIHPMVVHFPIALVYLSLALDLMAWLAPSDSRRFLTRAGWWALTAACVAILAAMAAGVISERSVRFTPQTSAILATHVHYAILTGACAGAAWLVRLASRFSRSELGRGEWSILGTGRGRLHPLATLLVAGSVLFITITGSLGGKMVYDHGVGVAGVSVRAPAATPARR